MARGNSSDSTNSEGNFRERGARFTTPPEARDERERAPTKDQEARGNNQVRLPKLEFPSFDGSKPRNWIRKCERYFTVFAIPEYQKVEIAAMYMTGRADN